jgi:hypothetical protein
VLLPSSTPLWIAILPPTILWIVTLPTQQMFSSLTSFCTICASTNCYSTTSSYSDFSMNTKSTNVAPSMVCSFAHQCLLLLHKNLIVDVLVESISWIIVYTNCIFSLYAVPSTHFQNDDECGGVIIANNWIFNTLSHYDLLNSSSTSILFNNSTSSYFLLLLLWLDEYF